MKNLKNHHLVKIKGSDTSLFVEDNDCLQLHGNGTTSNRKIFLGWEEGMWSINFILETRRRKKKGNARLNLFFSCIHDSIIFINIFMNITNGIHFIETRQAKVKTRPNSISKNNYYQP